MTREEAKAKFNELVDNLPDNVEIDEFHLINKGSDTATMEVNFKLKEGYTEEDLEDFHYDVVDRFGVDGINYSS